MKSKKKINFQSKTTTNATTLLFSIQKNLLDVFVAVKTILHNTNTLKTKKINYLALILTI